MSETPETLLVVSHVIHYAWGDRLHAYGPYVREIDIWADLFDRIVIAAPLRHEAPPAGAAAFTRANISVDPQIEAGGDDWASKLGQIARLPLIAWRLARSMRRADAIHVRCPGNLGLVGACLAPLFSTRLVAKYAGQWQDFPGASRAARLQKGVLQSRWWRGPVTVYGRWPNQPPHIVPFFSSAMTDEQMNRAAQVAGERRFDEPALRVLYVGQLGIWKNVDVLLRALADVRSTGVPLACDIVGDGPERQSLEALTDSLGLRDIVHFAGGVAPERVMDYYERAHVLVLASESEGWPKAITEAMAFGLVCVGSDRGLVPQILEDGRGFVVHPRDERALADTLLAIARSADRLVDMRARAAVWARQYSLESLRAAIANLLSEAWHVRISDASSGIQEPCA